MRVGTLPQVLLIQESLANANGSVRQSRPLVNWNTIPAVAENGVFFHTPLVFGAPAPYLPIGISGCRSASGN